MFERKSRYKSGCFPVSARRESGIILIIVLWILVILSVLAIGLSRRTSVELALTKYALSQARSRYIAWAGIQYAMAQILIDRNDKETNMFDTTYQCGIALEENQTPEQVFGRIKVGSGYFTIGYSLDQEGPGVFRYGFEDEERRLNINALSISDYKIFKNLLTQLGIEEQQAEQIAASVIDWRDENSELFDTPFGAEDDFYLGIDQSYHCKNNAFDSLEELMLVRGMTLEVFRAIKPFITIFPAQGRLLINFDTAPEPVLLALARNYAGPKTNTEAQDADSLVEKMLVQRRGLDGLDATADDRPIDLNELPLNPKEKVIALQMSTAQTRVSRYFRARVHGEDELWGASTDIDAVIHQDQGAIVSWHRD